MSLRIRLAAVGLAVALCVTSGCTAAPEPANTATPSESTMTTKQKIESLISDSSTTNSAVSASPVQDGLTTGWSVEIDRTSAEALTADELRGILDAVWKNATEAPAFIRLVILTAGGTQMVDAAKAAGELGIEYVTMREVYVFQGNAVEGLLGAWSAS